MNNLIEKKKKKKKNVKKLNKKQTILLKSILFSNFILSSDLGIALTLNQVM